jgi:hypothetical protein
VTDDHVLNAMGDDAIGLDHDVPLLRGARLAENKAFLAAYAQVAPNAGRANFMTVGAYDGMALIYDIIAKLGGKIDRRQGDGRREGLEVAEPARPDLHRSADARHRADDLRAPRREEGRRAVERRVRQVRQRGGSRQITRVIGEYGASHASAACITTEAIGAAGMPPRFFVRGGVMRRRLVSVNGTAAQERGAECSDRKRNGAASYDLDVDVGIR